MGYDADILRVYSIRKILRKSQEDCTPVFHDLEQREASTMVSLGRVTSSIEHISNAIQSSARVIRVHELTMASA